MAKQAILVAENDPDMRAVLVDCLGGFGWVVVAAENASEILERIRSHDVRIVVADIERQGGGLRSLEQLRKCVACPIVALTAFGGMLPAEALAMGASACLEKPFRIRELQSVVAWLLGKEVVPPTAPALWEHHSASRRTIGQ